MENASNALIMAAGVLVGVMILTIGVALFKTFSDFGREKADDLETIKIEEWNNNFLKYYGTVDQDTKNGGTHTMELKPIRVTAHDIVTVANFAKQYNSKYDYDASENFNQNENINYVQVCLENGSASQTNTHFENATDEEKTTFLKNNSLIIDTTNNTTHPKYYKCTECKVSSVTKKVYYVKYELYSE